AAVGAEPQRQGDAAVPLKGVPPAAGGDLPDPHGTIAPARSEEAAVRAKAHGLHAAAVPLHGSQQLADLGVPDLHRIRTADGEEAAAMAEIDRGTLPIRRQGALDLAGGPVPERYPVGIADPGNLLARGAELNAEDVGRVSAQGVEFRPRGRVQQPYFP